MIAVVFGISAAALAQSSVESEEDLYPPQRPLVVINIASVDRVFELIDTLFDAVDRPELAELPSAWLANANDLEGVDRTKPLGMLFFLKPGLPPQPFPAWYVSPSNVDELIKTIETAPIRVKKLSEGRYELIGEGGNDEPGAMGIHDDRAIVTPNADLLESETPGLSDLVESLSSRYDGAASLRLDSIPPGIRDTFLIFLRTRAQSELQQRDEEPETAYRIRRANGESMLAFLEGILQDGESVTLGLDALRDDELVVAELTVVAAAESKFAEYLKSVGGRRSRFAPLLTEEHPLSVSLSWRMDEREQTAARETFTAVRDRIAFELDEPESGGPVARFFDAILRTIEQGHADFVMQVQIQPSGGAAFVGGIGLTGADAAGSALTEIFGQLQGHPDLEAISPSVAEHQGVSIHRLQINAAPEQEQVLFGGQPVIYVGAGQEALWFAVGTDEAVPALTGSMDRVTEGNASSPDTSAGDPFRIVFRSSQWLKLKPYEDAGSDREIFDNAFTPTTDALRISARPTENGLRIRAEFERGFVRLLALALAQAFDQSLETEESPSDAEPTDSPRF